MTDVHTRGRWAVHALDSDVAGANVQLRKVRKVREDLDEMAKPSTGVTSVMIGSRVYARDGYVGTVVGTRERAHTQGDVLVRLGGPFGRWRSRRVVPAEWVSESERADRTRVAVERAAVVRCPHLRSDDAILAEVTRRAHASAETQWTREVGLSVHDGVVRLRCHPANERAIKCATEAVEAVAGVLGVEVI